jgi:uncharacterized protein YjbI with pentapeptide repeats
VSRSVARPVVPEPEPERDPFTGTLEPGEDYDVLSFTGLDLSGQDAQRAHFVECLLEHCTLDETRLDRAHLAETTLRDVHATTLHARDGVWRAVRWAEARCGALLAAGARLDDVSITGAKIDYLSLAGAKVDRLRLEHVSIGELDLGQAQVRRLLLVECRVDRLLLPGASLTECDLRGGDLGVVESVVGLGGATLTEEQAMLLVPAMARELGITLG